MLFRGRWRHVGIQVPDVHMTDFRYRDQCSSALLFKFFVSSSVSRSFSLSSTKVFAHSNLLQLALHKQVCDQSLGSFQSQQLSLNKHLLFIQRKTNASFP
ncbi:hypothetical protein XENORESO_018938 [Xenotaenia resolanae]|uniref:Uncharacterized protein n=1 Tax=Xenotaenia resolanae TaxID=208358 RepID=A0ABV0VY04_9TELE